MALNKRHGKLTGPQRAHLRRFGVLPPADATPAESFLYLSCVHYRELKFYKEHEVDEIKAMRLMIRSMAVAVVWRNNPDEVITEEAIKSVERDFMRRAKDDPPF